MIKVPFVVKFFLEGGVDDSAEHGCRVDGLQDRVVFDGEFCEYFLHGLVKLSGRINPK